MTTSAPNTRLVDALSGEITATPSQFFKALSEADALVADIDELHGLRTRVEELTADRDGYRESAKDLSTVLQSAFAEIGELEGRYHDLAEAHEITLGLLAVARRELLAVTKVEDWHGRVQGGLE